MSELFRLQPYRSTQLPELVAFFAEVKQQELLPKFLRRFASTRFTCPSHEMLGQMVMEGKAMELLREDSSIDGVLDVICETHIKFERLNEINRAVVGRALMPPFEDANSPKIMASKAIEAAQRHPKVPKEEVAAAFRLEGKAMDLYREGLGFKKKRKKGS